MIDVAAEDRNRCVPRSIRLGAHNARNHRGIRVIPDSNSLAPFDACVTQIYPRKPARMRVGALDLVAISP